MRIVRVGEPGLERVGVLVSDTEYVDVGDLVDDVDAAALAAGLAGALGDAVERRRLDGLTIPLGGRRIGAPIARPHQILCIGLNYLAHAEESRMNAPAEPVVFTKSPNSISGPYDVVVRPPGARKLDYEVELGVVIGRRCEYLASAEEAMDAVAGYVLVNDVSERDNQFRGEGQWLKGKSSATFNPCGPFFVTPDEFDAGEPIELWLDVNGVRRQTGTTREMIFTVGEIIQHLSRFMVLEPGDLINTGTPTGVAFGMDQPLYLEPGDRIALGGTRLGEQFTHVVDFAVTT